MSDDARAVSWNRIGNVTMVRFLVDRLTDLALAKQITDELKALSDRIGGKMILSLQNVEFMSSVGVSILVTFNQQLREANGRLKICDVQPLVGEIFRSIELEKAIELCHTKEQALIEFNSEQ